MSTAKKQQIDETEARNTSVLGEDPNEDPKRHPDPNSNAEKDPSDWVSGEEPMTGAQASYLKTLTEQAHKPEMFENDLTKAEASKRIDALKKSLSL